MAGAIMTPQSDEWATPQDLFDALNAEFGFTLDVCAGADNHKCAVWISKEVDALSRPWSATVERLPERCWMNPPFSLTAEFMTKAVEETRAGNLVVALIKAATDVAMWHELVMPHADEVRLIRGRLSYVQNGKSAPTTFPSCVVVFRPGLPGGPPPQFSAIDRQGRPIPSESEGQLQLRMEAAA